MPSVIVTFKVQSIVGTFGLSNRFCIIKLCSTYMQGEKGRSRGDRFQLGRGVVRALSLELTFGRSQVQKLLWCSSMPGKSKAVGGMKVFDLLRKFRADRGQAPCNTPRANPR